MRRIALTPDGIADLVENVLADGAGGWTMGVEGALAEFAVAGGGVAGTVRRTGLTVADGDPDALRLQDRGDLLVDLAAGHAAAAFCVRTGYAGLGKRLRDVEGLGWRDALDSVGHAIVAASPHRVVTTALGRIEVYAPIPPGWRAPPLA